MLGEFGIVYRAVLTTEKEPQPVAAKTLKGKHACTKYCAFDFLIMQSVIKFKISHGTIIKAIVVNAIHGRLSLIFFYFMVLLYTNSVYCSGQIHLIYCLFHIMTNVP